jgi:excisionase family DNA binding protein
MQMYVKIYTRKEVVEIGNMLSKKEAAERFKISEATLDRLRKRGLPFYQVGKKIRFDEDDLEKWFKKQK